MEGPRPAKELKVAALPVRPEPVPEQQRPEPELEPQPPLGLEQRQPVQARRQPVQPARSKRQIAALFLPPVAEKQDN